MIVKHVAAFGVFATIVLPVVAYAGDKPLYAPAPGWVVPAPPIDLAKLTDDAPVLLVFDNQQRLAGGMVSVYMETATRAATPEVLGQLGTIAIPWMPDKGDLTIHSAEILRGSETIDLLKTGEKFSVLRREQQLEQRMLSGMLTATMAAQGLRIGDVLRVRFTISQADPALKGQVQTVAPMLVEPIRTQYARTRMSWPVDTDIKVRSYLDGVVLAPKTVAGFRAVELAMPLPKPAELPGNLPNRFQQIPLVEATSFADWGAVSKAMAPLYATDTAIAPGSAVAGEVAKIVKAESDPVKRAAAALQVVQDQVRYLALGMNGGNYVPQTPAQTWELRYGDCKAKTLLLLAMLRQMGIEGEAVLVSSQGGDLVSRRLPMPGAFDHVIVRAAIGGKSYWLDGTGMGTRLADIADTPAFRYVLPLRVAGADLMPLPIHANARADMIVATTYDQTAGLDFPSVFRTEVKMRGGTAAMVNAASSQASAKQKREMIQGMVNEAIGQAQIGDAAMAYDASSGIATITASGVVSTPWRRDEKRMRWGLDRAIDAIDFEPDRSRTAWRELPVATDGPGSTEYRTTVKLPDGGVGYILEGDQALSATIAGVTVVRRTAMAGGVVTVEERSDQIGTEILPGAVAAERQKVALAKSRELRVVAPPASPARWEQVIAARKDARFAPIEAVFAKAIAADPDEPTGYESRASFRKGTYDRRGAIADLTKLIGFGGEGRYYLQRAGLHTALGDNDRALADAKEALALDPGSNEAINVLAAIQADRGEFKPALAMLQDRIDVGGKDRFPFYGAKATVQAKSGDVTGAIGTLDAALAERPGDPTLLNERCWTKGTGNVMLDTALKDCTKAIELADDPAAALDSRALVYLRMGRMDDALADLDAALDGAPGSPGSLFLRGVIRGKRGDAAGAANDLAGARLISPQVDKTYAKYGIAP